MSVRYTLTSEGSSDRMLLPVIDWTLSSVLDQPFEGTWANPAVFATNEKDVETRMTQAIRYFPCDILFAHRDCDGVGFEERKNEIDEAVARLGLAIPIICVIPVKMTEAWFLFDENAIRLAADNPNGTVNLDLPSHKEAQRRANPKALLEKAILDASETEGRRRKDFERRLGYRKNLVAHYIDDFSSLEQHDSYRQFRDGLRAALAEL